MATVTFKCCVCGREKTGEVERLPQLGIEIAELAKAAGWIGVLEFPSGRGLIFCSERCNDAALRKDGKSYRKYIPTLPQEPPEGGAR